MSTVAKKVIMGSGAVEAVYEIDQSLIFNKASAAKLERTPSSGGNRRTFTISTWFKIGEAAVSNYSYYLFGAHVNGQNNDNSWFSLIFYNGDLRVSGWNQNWLRTNRVFRDHSAWYHVVVAVDTTSGTANNRVRIYINGVEETSFAVRNNPDQNFDFPVNRVSYPQTVGSVSYASAKYWDGYMAEYHLIDGTALTPSSFGETNSDTGQWIPKEYEGGSYGTNGFYLKFKSGAIGTDSSGQGNNYTASNLANSDVVPDSPTNNFCTVNSAVMNFNGNVTFAEGNLQVTLAAGGGDHYCSFKVPETGKWYYEFIALTNVNQYLGVISTRQTYANGSWAYADENQTLSLNNGHVDPGAGSNITNYIGSAYSTGDIVGVALDCDNSKMYFAKNGTWGNPGLATTNPATGAAANPITFVASKGWQIGGFSAGAITKYNFGQNGTFSGSKTAQGNADGNSIGDFYYAPPSGFLALCTANLPDPAIPLPSAQFNTVLYTGNGSTQSISGVGHQPDWVWIKNRATTDNHKLVNAVRGSTKELESNTTDAEATNADGVTAFASDGFALGDDAEYNTNSEAYVSWNWKANGSGSTDTSGDIDCVLSANPTAGFSVLSFTGNNSNNDTIPHGLGVVPDFVWYKAGDSSWENWIHSSIISGNKRMLLQSTAAESDINSNYLLGGEIATSSMISNNGLTTSQAVVAWCFASIPGYSKIQTYYGAGTADYGPYVNLGFRPAWVIIKKRNGAGAWMMFDNKRSSSNDVDTGLVAESNAAEFVVADFLDFTATGFRIRNNNANTNTGGDWYLYMAFAESPFKYANAR